MSSSSRTLLVRIVGKDAELQGALKRSSANIQRFGKVAGRIGRDMTKKVTAPIAGAGAGLLALTVKAANYADAIDKAAIRTGIGRGELQELQFAADQLGVSFDTITGATEALTRRIPQLEQGTSNSAKAFAGLGVDLHDSKGELRSMGDLFPDVIGALSKIENETQRNAIATQIFGRRAADIVPVLAAGGDQMQELMGRARDLGLVMGDRNIAALVKFKDSMAEIREQVRAVGTRLATAFLPLMEKIADFVQSKVVPSFHRFVEWIERIDQHTKETVAIVLALVAAVGPLTLAIAGAASMLAFLLTPLGVVAAGMAALAVVATTVARNWDVLKLQGTLAWAALKSAVFDAVGGIIGMLEKLAGWVPGLGDRIRALRGEFDAFAEGSLAKSGERIYELERALGAATVEVQNFSEEVTSVAGSGGGMDDFEEGSEDVVKALEKLSAGLSEAVVMQALLGDRFDLASAQAGEYETAVRALVAAGVDLDAVVGPQGETLRELADRYLDLTVGIEAATEAEREAARIKQEAARVMESVLTPAERYRATMDELSALLKAGAIDQETFNRAAAEAREVLEGGKQKASELGGALEQMAGRGLDAMTDFATGSKEAIAAFAKQAVRDLMRVLARALAVKALTSVASGGSSGLLAGAGGLLSGVPGRAAGGPVLAGKPYWVGEEGPELILPRSSGTVIPSAASLALANSGGQATAVRLDTSSLPPRPSAVTPDALAMDDWWRRAFTALEIDRRDRGGRDHR